MGDTSQFETYYDFVFHSMQTISCVLLFVLYLLKRRNKVVRSRIFIPHFILLCNAINSAISILVYFVPIVDCYVKIFVVAPLMISILMSFCVVVSRHLVINRVVQIKNQFMESLVRSQKLREKETLIESLEENVTSSKNTDAEISTNQDSTLRDNESIAQSSEGSQQRVESVQNVGDSPLVKSRMDKSRISQSFNFQMIHILSRISKSWFLFILLIIFIIFLELLFLVTFFAWDRGTNIYQENPCGNINNLSAIYISGFMVLYTIAMFVLLVLNALSSREEILKCQFKDVFLTNDPFLFSITTLLFFLCMFTLVVMMSILPIIRVSTNSIYGRIGLNLLGGFSSVWIICGIPVLYAIYQDIRIYVIQRRSEYHRAKNIELSQGDKGPISVIDLFQPNGDSIKIIMNDDTLSKLFEKFSNKEFSPENVFLYKQIQAFYDLYDQSPLKASHSSLDIYNTFIRSGSILEVNLTGHCREGVASLIEAFKKNSSNLVPKEIFDSCYVEVVSNLCDTYRRFYQWREFKSYLNNRKNIV